MMGRNDQFLRKSELFEVEESDIESGKLQCTHARAEALFQVSVVQHTILLPLFLFGNYLGPSGKPVISLHRLQKMLSFLLYPHWHTTEWIRSASDKTPGTHTCVNKIWAIKFSCIVAISPEAPAAMGFIGPDLPSSSL